MTNKKGKKLEKRDVDFIEGEFINMKQSTVRSVEGSHIELQQVGALSIDAEKIEVTQGASALLRGNEVNLNQSISAVTAAENVSVNFSFTPLSLSREKTTANKSAVGFMAAKEIKSENTSAFLLLTNKVEGNVTTLFDWRSAISFGAIFGGILGFLSLLSRRK
jgi:hypothetical protein